MTDDGAPMTDDEPSGSLAGFVVAAVLAVPLWGFLLLCYALGRGWPS